MEHILIVYYSRKGENYWNGEIRSLEKGNTEIVAELIQEAVGGDLFEIETETPYSADYATCTQEAQQELRDNARPALKEYPDDLDGYDTIFVGYPNWWGTMPMALFTFLERYNLSGKRILPFCTNEGSGMGRSEKDLRNLCAGATIEHGLAVRGSEAAQSKGRVNAWLKSLNPGV
ncbi:MAG: flavodoxin [Candidatus Onthomonas sp.]